ncbi:Heterokaryon incompatibility protein (HET) domain containing protein, partial [Rhypophila sp. PSN 637]
SFRLIDCESRTLVSATVGQKYTALSYVWERGPRILAQSRHRGFRIGDEVPGNLLSPAVEDGLRATQELGFRYLWVDKICIDQTSQQDKEEQIGMMRSVYQGAELTLISPCYDESEYFPGVGKSRHQTHGIRIGDFTLLERPIGPELALNMSIWRTRGWTFQEEMLSRRTLYFLDGQALFICNRGIYGELFDDSKVIEIEEGEGIGPDRFLGPDQILALRMRFAWGLPFHDYNRPLGCRGTFGCMCQAGIYKSFATIWDVLYHYTWRELTYDADTLRAVEGCLTLASGFQHPIQFVLGIGFPKALQHNESHDYELRSYFTAGLTWFHQSGGLSRHRGPSWTWASWRVTHQPS